MTGQVFDEIARRLSHGMGRREALALIGGALAAMLVDRESVAYAACKRVGQNCDRNGDCCDGARCRQGRCECKASYDECEEKCYILAEDERHCGGCGNACAASDICCDGACADPGTDDAHCGACNTACAAGQSCCAGACADLDSDRRHCGACGVRCDVGWTCEDGTCGRATEFRCLDENATDCDGECADLQSDRQHCGACGHRCAQGERCCGGTCTRVISNHDHCGACGNTCREIETCCNGECVDLEDDVRHCGGCGWACPEGSDRCVYSGGSAGMVCCFPGQEYSRAQDCGELGCCNTPAIRPCSACTTQERCCNDRCLNVQGDDRANCGGCGRTCDAASICSNGQCVACPPGRVVCGNVCCIA